MRISTRPTETRRRRVARGFAFGVLALVAAVAGLWAYAWIAATSEAGPMGGPFHLVDGSGRPVSDQDFRGRYLLIYFGYVSCPDICPTTLQAVAAAMDELGAKADRIQPIFITVDPARDTPAVVARYATIFSKRLIGLSGDQQQIDAAKRAFHVYSRPVRTGPDPDDYSVDHSSALYLVDPGGHLVEILPAETSATAIARRLERVVE